MADAVCPSSLQVSERLGYHGYGLGALTQQVLGFELPKSRKVTMSNWEAWALSPQQIQYAALDALTTGHVFRALRRWHASPSACTSCRQALGAVSGGSLGRQGGAGDVITDVVGQGELGEKAVHVSLTEEPAPMMSIILLVPRIHHVGNTHELFNTGGARWGWFGGAVHVLTH